MSKAEEAEALFKSGANCAQAVLGAFCGECGLDRETALKLASGFGAGMGRMREVCGAVSAMFIVANLKYGNSDLSDKRAKDAHYAARRTFPGGNGLHYLPGAAWSRVETAGFACFRGADGGLLPETSLFGNGGACRPDSGGVSERAVSPFNTIPAEHFPCCCGIRCAIAGC